MRVRLWRRRQNPSAADLQAQRSALIRTADDLACRVCESELKGHRDDRAYDELLRVSRRFLAVNASLMKVGHGHG